MPSLAITKEISNFHLILVQSTSLNIERERAIGVYCYYWLVACLCLCSSKPTHGILVLLGGSVVQYITSSMVVRTADPHVRIILHRANAVSIFPANRAPKKRNVTLVRFVCRISATIMYGVHYCTSAATSEKSRQRFGACASLYW